MRFPSRSAHLRLAASVATLLSTSMAFAGDRDDDRWHTPLRGGTLTSADCAALAGTLRMPDTAFTASNNIAAGTLKLAGKDLPAHCQLLGKMFERTSTVDGQTYSIGFEMRLPLEWNGRFFYQANGGIDGAVVTATGNTSGGGPLTSALLQGFAAISSDAGHSGAQNPIFGIDPQARLDYGYQTVGKLTPMAKQVIRVAYGHAPGRSYLGGCSNGGRHGMVAASRFTEQFDGYLVGAPGFNLPKAAVANIYGAQQYSQVVGGGANIADAFTAAERALLSRKVLERCDALDGLADGLIQEVEACQRKFDLRDDVPTCAGARDGTCLTPAQKDAIGNIFRGARDSRGRPIYASFPYDSGHGAGGTAFWEFTAPLVLDSGAVGFVFGTPPQSPTAFNGPAFSLGSSIDDLYRSIFATSSTYRESGMAFMTPVDPSRIDDRLRRTNARMLVYHGVSDAIFSIDDTTRWYRSLRQSGGHGWRHDGDDRDDRHGGGSRAGEVVRLFHVPGMNHCSGGPAVDQFDMLGALVDWVERGRSPERVIATARGTGNAGGVNAEVPAAWAPDRTRPLCAYPRVAKYKGGDPERAESFVCR